MNKTLLLLAVLIAPLTLHASSYETNSHLPQCAFYPELCISIEGPVSCQGVGQYCGPGSNVCCEGLKCVPSGSALIGAHRCYPPKED